MEYHIANLVGDIFSTWLGTQYYSVFGEKQTIHPAVKKVIICCSLVISMIGSTFVLYNSPFVMPLQVVALFVLSLLYKFRWYVRILYVLICYLFFGLSELIVGMFFNAVFDNFLEARENVNIYLICSLTARLIAFLAIRTVRLFATKQFAIDLKSIVFLMPLPIATFLQLFIFIKVYYYMEDTYYSVFMVIFCIVMIFANLSVFVFLDRMNDYTEKKTDLMLYEQEYKAQKLHLQSLQEHLNETRAFRHDTKNKLLSIIALMEAGENEKVIKELKKSLNILDENAKDIINSGHPILDALLQNKLRENKPKGITVKPIIRITDELHVNEIDMGVLLGNIVDNAIEATERLSAENRIPIEVRILCSDGLVSVNVINAVDYDVDTENLRTIKKDKLIHGYGVKQIKNIVAKYNGTAEFSCKDNVFSVKTTMANRPRQS